MVNRTQRGGYKTNGQHPKSEKRPNPYNVYLLGESGFYKGWAALGGPLSQVIPTAPPI